MALNLNNKYPGRANPPSIDYPEGSIKNQTAPGAKDGTPLDADWANDKEGFFQSLLAWTGLSADGSVDKVGSSQYFDALTSPPTESKVGMSRVSTQSETNGGSLDNVFVSPKKLRAGFSVSLAQNGYVAFPTWMGGLIIQWGRKAAGTTGLDSATFPIAFPNACFSGVAVNLDTTIQDQVLALHITSMTLTTINVSKLYANDGGFVGDATQGWSYIVIGH